MGWAGAATSIGSVITGTLQCSKTSNGSALSTAAVYVVCGYFALVLITYLIGGMGYLLYTLYKKGMHVVQPRESTE